MLAESTKTLEEVVEDLCLDKTAISYLEWKIEVQRVAKGK